MVSKLQRARRKTGYPERLILDVTRRCNLRCFMCTEHKYDEPGSHESYSDMPMELFLKLEPLFPELETIVLGGLGEPFLDSGLAEKLEIIRRSNKRVYISAITNGTTLKSAAKTEKIFHLIDELHLSLNGVETYEGIMIGAKKNLIMENLKTIHETNRKMKNKVVLSLGFIVMKRNIDDIIPATLLAMHHGFNKICFKNMWIHDDEMFRESVIHDEELHKKALETISEAHRASSGSTMLVRSELSGGKRPLKQKAADLFRLLRSMNARAYPYGYLIKKKLKDKFRRSVACRDPWEAVQVFDSGEVFLCCNGGTKIGDLTEESFDEIWNGEEVNNYRKGMASGNYYKDCSKCKIIFPEDAASYLKPRG